MTDSRFTDRIAQLDNKKLLAELAYNRRAERKFTGVGDGPSRTFFAERVVACVQEVARRKLAARQEQLHQQQLERQARKEVADLIAECMGGSLSISNVFGRKES